jgi:hypothetical protein
VTSRIWIEEIFGPVLCIRVRNCIHNCFKCTHCWTGQPSADETAVTIIIIIIFYVGVYNRRRSCSYRKRYQLWLGSSSHVGGPYKMRSRDSRSSCWCVLEDQNVLNIIRI